MAIRIAGPRQQAAQPPAAAQQTPPIEEVEVPEVPEMEQETPEQPEAVSEPAMLTESAGKVSPQVARYMTSDMGPFICANCQHFQDDGSCEVVSGPIDPEGVCILFTPPDQLNEGMPEGEEPMEETEEMETE